jgi:hypothetical protein
MNWNVQNRLKRFSNQGLAKKTVASVATLAAAGMLLTGCATISEQTHPDLGSPHVAPTTPQSVQLLTAPPKEPYVRLGEVILSVDGNPPREKLEQRLKAAAAKLGADGIYISSDQTHIFPVEYLGYWGPSRDEYWHRLITGVAYKNK